MIFELPWVEGRDGPINVLNIRIRIEGDIFRCSLWGCNSRFEGKRPGRKFCSNGCRAIFWKKIRQNGFKIYQKGMKKYIIINEKMGKTERLKVLVDIAGEILNRKNRRALNGGRDRSMGMGSRV